MHSLLTTSLSMCLQQQVEKVYQQLMERKNFNTQFEYDREKCSSIRADLERAATLVLSNPSLLDLVTEAQLQAAQGSAADTWLPAPDSNEHDKACIQLQELRAAIESHHGVTGTWDVDAAHMATFLALPFSMEETTSKDAPCSTTPCDIRYFTCR